MKGNTKTGLHWLSVYLIKITSLFASNIIIRRTIKMKYLNPRTFFIALLLMMVGIFILVGCDSGEKVVDEVTGNQAVKQYHKLKKDIGKIADQQAKKYDEIPDDDNKEYKEKR